MSEEVFNQAELKKDWPRFRIVSAPEGLPTFIDDNGEERQLLRITEGKFASEKDARRIVEFSNWDVHIEHDGPLYEIISLEEVE